jgi:hypothetical protein
MKSSALANPFGLEPGGSKVPLRIAVIGATSPFTMASAKVGNPHPLRSLDGRALNDASRPQAEVRDYVTTAVLR